MEKFLSNANSRFLTGANYVFMGVDPGYDRCGYALVKATFQGTYNFNFELKDWGYITSSKRNTFAERLFEVVSDLKKIIKMYRVDYLFVEDVLFSKNKKTSLFVAKVIGGIIYVAKEANVEMLLLNPVSVKKGITGVSDASKKQVEYMVRNIYKNNLGIMIDDVFDAFAVLYVGARKLFLKGQYLA